MGSTYRIKTGRGNDSSEDRQYIEGHTVRKAQCSIISWVTSLRTGDIEQ